MVPGALPVSNRMKSLGTKPNTRCLFSTSGTTGQPGILHTTGGYLTQVTATARDTFDLSQKPTYFWCTADVSWVTGHLHMYGPMSNGATRYYEGTPDTPHRGRWWKSLKIRHPSAPPTAIRSAMKWRPRYTGRVICLRLALGVGW